MRKVLIIGATSAIAEATAKLFAKQGDRLYLLGRNKERLDTLSQDLTIRGADSVSWGTLDVNQFEDHQSTIDKAHKSLDGIDIAFIAHGTLPEQKQCEQNFELALKELNTNAISVISLASKLANIFESQGQGTIAVISSVAGDRGRQSNYIYGTAKGAVTIYLQGLRNRLFKSGVHVLTVKPGFVDTPMTREFDKGALWVKPDKIAKDIYNGIQKNKNVIYTPKIWFLIMAIIKSIPEFIFKRMSL